SNPVTPTMRCGAYPRNEGGRHTSRVWPQDLGGAPATAPVTPTMRCGACPRNEGGRHTSRPCPQEPEPQRPGSLPSRRGRHPAAITADSPGGPRAGDDRTDAEEESHEALSPTQAQYPEPGCPDQHRIPHL